MSKRQWIPLLSCLLVIAACGTRPPVVPEAPVAPADTFPARPTLMSEQARLSGLFKGTPVAFTMQADGSLRVTVPRDFSFDPGASKVKPPLAAVLERLAKSQALTGSRLRVTAPPDAQSRGPALPRDRALAVRDYLIGHGISPVRMQASGGAAPAEPVEIVVTDMLR